MSRCFSGSPYNASTAYWLSEIRDRHGNGITIARRTDGTPVTVSHDGGYQIRIGSDGGRITTLTLTSPQDPVTLLSYGYDEIGDLTTVTNSSGLPLCFTYDAHGRITSWTDRNDSTFTYVYDAAGRVVQTVGPEGFLSSVFAYDTDARITRYTDSVGATTTFQLNERLQVVATTDPMGHTTCTELDAHDRIISVTDALGQTTRLAHDTAGRPVELIRADGRRTTVTYNDLGLPATLTEPDGAIWHHHYDTAGNRIALTDPAGATTRYTYDGRGAVTSVTDAVGLTVNITRNTAGLPLSVIDAAGSTTRHDYDPFGRLVQVTNPLGATTSFAWSTEGLLTSRTTPQGATERWSFDGEGNCTTYTDPLGQTTTFEYGHFDLPILRVAPDGARYTYRHDTELRLTHVVSPQGLTWTYRYDGAGRLVCESDFDGRTVTYAYDAADQLVARTNAAGQQVHYQYDSVGNLVEKDLDGRRVTYTNDPCGRLTHAVGPDSTLELGYDPAGRLVTETVDGRTLTTHCDAAGRRTARTTPSGAVTTYRYDSTTGRRTGLTTAGHTLTFEHNAMGRETTRRLDDVFTLQHTWDPQGLLSHQLLTTPAPGQAPVERGYTYRADGTPTAITDRRTGHRSYTLDQAGRVTQVEADGWRETYTYDQDGNQTHATWPHNHPHAHARGQRTYNGSLLTRAGHLRYEHDDQGRVVMRQHTRLSRKPDTWHYSWDAEDRLTAVTTPDGTRWRYLYDPLGRRTAKQRLGDDGNTAVEETLFTWDGTTLTEQTTRRLASPEALTLTWDHDGTTPLAQTETKRLADAPQSVLDQRFFAIVTDQIGTPTELVDETGQIAWHTRSAVWGTTTWNRDATAYTPLRFPGQYYDPESELHHNYFRYYDPQTARYLSLDPLGLDPAPNPYTYVDNPLRYSDPLGLAACNEDDVT
ncbi:RHS repeat-associated core domain-containing protein [Streptomyces sp. NPDC051211]|uniref:RHS repeat-associated core domain-containing protein n=1 Tax=Streptomyces sp. NPDC051211 TaxID=3154643 RepID=UPI00344BF2FE